MKQYLDLVQAIFDDGVVTGDRTGTGTISRPSYEYTCKMYKDEEGTIHNFPLLTTKDVDLRSVFEELMWKLNGETNIKPLVERGIHIWTEWPFKKWLKETKQYDVLENMYEDESRSKFSKQWKETKKLFEDQILNDEEFCARWGELGRTYGFQFRRFGEVRFEDLDPKFQEALIFSIDGRIPNPIVEGEDQLMDAIDLIKEDPESRRIIITLWNPKDKDEDRALLPPCPFLYQFFAYEKDILHLKMSQRSSDTFLGVPYNTAQDALFLCMMAQVTGRKPGMFIHSFSNAHIYLNHVKQMKEQLTRTPHQLPSIRLNPNVKNILDFTWKDIELIDYEHDKSIRGAVSIWSKSYYLEKTVEIFALRFLLFSVFLSNSERTSFLKSFYTRFKTCFIICI